MSRLPTLSIVAGAAVASFVAVWSASALAQTAAAGSKSDPKTAPTTSGAATSTKPLTPQGPLAAKPAPAPTVVSPDSKTLATRPLPATTAPPATPPRDPKKCADQRPQGDC
jgi:hypothetical protein